MILICSIFSPIWVQLLVRSHALAPYVILTKCFGHVCEKKARSTERLFKHSKPSCMKRASPDSIEAYWRISFDRYRYERHLVALSFDPCSIFRIRRLWWVRTKSSSPSSRRTRLDRLPRRLKWQRSKWRKWLWWKSILKPMPPRKVKFKFAAHHCLLRDALRWFLCYHVIFVGFFSFLAFCTMFFPPVHQQQQPRFLLYLASINWTVDMIVFFFFLLDRSTGALSPSLLITPSVDLYIYTYSYTYTYRYADIFVCPRRFSLVFFVDSFLSFFLPL